MGLTGRFPQTCLPYQDSKSKPTCSSRSQRRARFGRSYCFLNLGRSRLQGAVPVSSHDLGQMTELRLEVIRCMRLYSLDIVMRKHFTSVICFLKTHNPSLITRKTPNKPQCRTVYKIPWPVLLHTHKVIEIRSVQAQKKPNRHDDYILLWILEQEEF